jgi:hypothetical protein
MKEREWCYSFILSWTQHETGKLSVYKILFFVFKILFIREPYVFMEQQLHAMSQRKEALVKIAEAIARPWFGYTLFPENWVHQWVISGLNTYAAYEAVKEVSEK